MEESLNPFDYAPSRRLPARIGRRLTQWRTAKPNRTQLDRAIITFTFDDFPRSAANTGAEIIESIGARATFYTCSGLMSAENITGPIYTPDDLVRLSKAGHELGAHTHTHLDCAKAPVQRALCDIDQNRAVLANQFTTCHVSSFAYPYGETTFKLKFALMERFQTCRGILPGLNRSGSDLMQLRAMELTPEAWTLARAQKAIERATRECRWLIFFTHDVRERPSPFGIRPNVLRQLVRQARDSGAEILTCAEAAARMG